MGNKSLFTTGLIVLVLVLASGLWAQRHISKSDRSTTSTAQARTCLTSTTASGAVDRIAEELQQIRAQLTRIEKRLDDVAPGNALATVSMSGRYSIGRRNAPVVLAEFADYQCPFCRRFYAEAFQKLRAHYIRSGKVRFVAFNLPLNIHPNAFHAAEAALCAGQQSKFWQMDDQLFTSPNGLGSDAILRYAEQLGLDKASFLSCLKNRVIAAKVEQDVDLANDLGISGTPTFILGRSRNGKLEGVKIVGALSYDRLVARIQTLLDPNARKD